MQSLIQKIAIAAEASTAQIARPLGGGDAVQGVAKDLYEIDFGKWEGSWPLRVFSKLWMRRMLAEICQYAARINND